MRHALINRPHVVNFFFAFCLKPAEHCYDAFPPWYVKPRVWKSNHRNALLCQWKSDLYRNMTFWRWVLKVFKRPRKPTAEKSTSENPRRKRPIFVMENIFCRKVRYSKHQRNGFLKDCNFTREFSISCHHIWCAHAIVVYCMQMNLVMSMRFIFADDWNDAPGSSRFCTWTIM